MFSLRFFHICAVVLVTLVSLQVLVYVAEVHQDRGRMRKVKDYHRIRLRIEEFRRKKIQMEIELRLEILRNSTTKKSYSRTPDVIVIGAAGCEADKLTFFLDHHPLVRYTKTTTNFYTRNRKRDLRYYRSTLLNATADEIILESSASYFYAPMRNLPSIINRDCPGVKLIFVICDPVKRALSAYTSNRAKKSEMAKRSFVEHAQTYLSQVKNIFQGNKRVSDKIRSKIHASQQLSIYAFGLYSEYIRRWMDVFTLSRIMIMNGDTFQQDPGSHIESVQRFLSIPVVLHATSFARHPGTGSFCLRPWWYKEHREVRATNFDVPRLQCDVNSGQGTFKGNCTSGTANACGKLRIFYESFNRKLEALTGQQWKWDGQPCNYTTGERIISKEVIDI